MEIRMPYLAEGVESGTVVSLLVKEGDKVSKEQNLLELETNKAVANIPSPSDGVITKIHVKEGAQVAVGQLLMTVAETSVPGTDVRVGAGLKPAPTLDHGVGARRAVPLQAITPPAPIPESQTPYQYHSPSGSPPPASPSVRRLARKLGIDLTRVRGTEHGGRITMADVRNYILALQVGARSPRPVPGGETPPLHPPIDFSKWGPVTRKPLTPLRKTISQAMTDSWTTIPRVTQFDDILISQVTALRKQFAPLYEKKNVRLTLTAFILKALVKALKKHPIFNSSLDEAAREIVLKGYYHIGIAVDTEHGLMVPVMRDVDKKSFLEISRELGDLAKRTRERKLSVEEMRGAGFTISNQGGIGGTHFTPIINKPEVAILGIGRGYEAPVVVRGSDPKRGQTPTKKGEIQIAMLMPVGLSYDHRVIDGGSAARFMVDFAQAMNEFTESDLAGLTESKKKGKKS